jgi:signal transduction histidine kinase
LPGVTVTQLQILGHGSAPAAAAATYDDLASGRFHYQLVQVEGLGRLLTQVDENRSVVQMMLGGRMLEVRVDAPPTAAPNLVDARLRVTGLAAGGINDRRQLVFPYLRVAGWNDVAVAEPPPDLDNLPVTPVANLLRFGIANENTHRVRVRGRVLATFADGRVFLRDAVPPSKADAESAEEEPRSIGVQLVRPEPVSVGAVIEVIGFPVMSRFSATLADASLASTETDGSAAPPREVTPEELIDGRWDSDLVTLKARLAAVFRTSEGYDLRLETGAVSLRANLPEDLREPHLEPGSLLRLTGICQIESSTDKGFRSRADRAVLLLRGPEDLRILESPSWWTAQRLATALAVCAGVVLLGLIWIAVLRRQVLRQSAALSSGIAQKAALEERQRIAREFHDTLEQELAGLSLRLDAAVTRPLEEKARGLLEASRQLVKRVQAEARNLVSDLRADATVTAELGAALRDLARRASAEGLVSVEAEVEETMPPLPAHVVHHLRMIAQEAVANALKHARAGHIVITASLRHGRLGLTISDDGGGMLPEQSQGQPGHFGCMGIRERVRGLGGEVQWLARDGGGTVVQVQLQIADPSG